MNAVATIRIFTCPEYLLRRGYLIDGPTRYKRILIRDVQHAVALRYRLPVEEMWSPRQAREYAHPRQVAMYLAAKVARSSYADIGRRFRRDHSTVIHGVRQIEKRLDGDPALRHRVEEIRRELEG